MTDQAPKKTQSAWRSPWIIGLICLGAVFVAANAHMIWLSINKAPSLVAENYYERGQNYEENRLKRLSQEAEWNMVLTKPDSIVMNQPAAFDFSLVHKQGSVASPDSVVLYAYRPSDSGADFNVTMEELSTGEYRALLSFPLKGVWDLLATVTQGEREYHVALRVNVAVN